jgi:alpha-glucosidase
MYVDEKTRTISGRRDVNPATLSDEGRQRETTLANELSVIVVAGTAPTSFTLYEDDGITLGYLKGNVRETRIVQEAEGDQVRVTVEKSQGGFHNANSSRASSIKLIVDSREATGVEVNGSTLPKLNSCMENIGVGKVGWCNQGRNLILIRSEIEPVDRAKHYVIRLTPLNQ